MQRIRVQLKRVKYPKPSWFALAAWVLNSTIMIASFKTDAFVKDIIKKRESENAGIRTVASLIGVKPDVIFKIECGTVPKAHVYAALCKWMGKSPLYYITIKTK